MKIGFTLGRIGGVMKVNREPGDLPLRLSGQYANRRLLQLVSYRLSVVGFNLAEQRIRPGDSLFNETGAPSCLRPCDYRPQCPYIRIWDISGMIRDSVEAFNQGRVVRYQMRQWAAHHYQPHWYLLVHRLCAAAGMSCLIPTIHAEDVAALLPTETEVTMPLNNAPSCNPPVRVATVVKGRRLMTVARQGPHG